MNSTKTETPVDSIHHVKSALQVHKALSNDLKKYGGQHNKKLLSDMVFSPVTVVYRTGGTTDNLKKFSIDATRRKWMHDTAKDTFIEGHWAEFGVREGQTMNYLLEAKPHQVIHAFDSWEGLPEEWYDGSNSYQKGDMKVEVPNFPTNVKCHKGWFEDTIDPWKDRHPGPMAYVHIDCDLYSSAKTVLEKLNDRIVTETILVFDEMANFRMSGKMSTWPNGEWLALNEWLRNFDRAVAPIRRTCMYQAAFRVIK
jgi:hypothetical protein